MPYFDSWNNRHTKQTRDAVRGQTATLRGQAATLDSLLASQARTNQLLEWIGEGVYKLLERDGADADGDST